MIVLSGFDQPGLEKAGESVRLPTFETRPLRILLRGFIVWVTHSLYFSQRNLRLMTDGDKGNKTPLWDARATCSTLTVVLLTAL